MSKKRSISLEDAIGSALDSCIGKMAGRLAKTFNPEEKDSLALFRQFCSALKTRLQWLKDQAKKMDGNGGTANRTKTSSRNSATASNNGPTWTERMMNRINPNNPVQDKALNNALVIARE